MRTFAQLRRLRYERASTLAAHRWSRSPGVGTLRRVESAWEESKPNDFFLVIDADRSESCALLDLRKDCRDFKKEKKRTLGKIHAATSEAWERLTTLSPSFLLRFQNQKNWEAGKWSPFSIGVRSAATAADRFLVCLEHYFSAGKTLGNKSAKNGNVALFREISQAIDYSSGEKVHLKNGNPASLFADALFSQHRLIHLIAEQRDLPSIGRVEFGRDAGERFSQDLLSRRWSSWLRKSPFKKYPLEVGTVPRTFRWAGDKRALGEFLNLYLRHCTMSGENDAFPIVLSAQVHDAHLQALTWKNPLEILEWVPLPLRSDAVWMEQFRRNFRQSAWNRLLHLWFSIGGDILSGETRRIQATLFELCEMLLVLGANCATKDFDALADQAQRVVPQAAKLYRDLMRPQEVSFLVTGYLTLEPELLNFTQSTSSQISSPSTFKG